MKIDMLTKKERQQSYSDSFAPEVLRKLQDRMARAEREEENECEE